MKIFIVLVLLISYSVCDLCGGNCPDDSCPTCPCGNSANKVDITDICSQYSWDHKCCECIANLESAGNANIVDYYAGKDDGSEGPSYDVGVFKINSFNWDECSGGLAPCDPNANLKCAQMVYDSGGWKMWPTAAECGCT